MTPFNKYIIAPLLTLVSCSSGQRAESAPPFVPYTDTHLQYMGRIGNRGGSAALLSWPGSSVTMNFTGTEVSAMLEDDKGTDYFNVVIDGKPMAKLQVTNEKKLYPLATGLKQGKHSVQLFKLTESSKGRASFYGFQLGHGGDNVGAIAPMKHKMEFYGASIQCGLSIEAVGPDNKTPQYENNYLSYCALTARHYDAEYRCIAKSGIGFMVSWFPLIMPEMYDRTDAENADGKWDFHQYTPDVVVIFIGQNDMDIISDPKLEEFRARFKVPPAKAAIETAYKSMVADIRAKYPKAAIICQFTRLADSPWPGYIQQAVESMHDGRIFFQALSPWEGKGHPRVKDNERMAAELEAFIDEHQLL